MAFAFTVSLTDLISGPAKSMSKSVFGISNELKTLKSAIASTENAMTRAKALGDTEKFDALSGKLGNLKDAFGESATGIDGFKAELAEMSGGLTVAIGAVVAVGAALGGLVIAGSKLAIESVEAREKMTSLFDALGGGAIAGKDVIGMIDTLGDSIGQTRKQLAPLTQEFLTMGITGEKQLRGLTLAAASAGAIADGGAEKFTTFFGVVNAAAQTGSKLTLPFKKLEKQLQGVGLNIGDLAKEMGITEPALTHGLKAGTINARAFGDALTAAATSKGAGPLARAGMSLSNIWGKAVESVSKWFEDIDVGSFLGEVKSLFDILGQGKASGNALKSGVGGFFSETFRIATKLVPMVKHFLLDLIIFGLKAYIATKPIVKNLKEIWEQHGGFAKLQAIFSLMKPMIMGIAIATGVVVGAFGLLVAWTGFVVSGLFILVGAVSQFVGRAAATLGDWAKSAIGFAKDFILGLVNGITGGASAVVDSVKGIAGSAKDAFKNALGIHSPSTVMAQLGGHVAGGAAQGIAGGVPDVHEASRDLASASAGGFASGAKDSGGGSNTGGGSITINVEPGAIVVQGAGKGAEELSEAMLAPVFERLALAQGL